MDIKKYLVNLFQSGEYSRPNQFSSEIYSPIDSEFSTKDIERICLNIASAPIPGIAVETKEYSQGGFLQKKLPHTKQYQELGLRFYLSEDHIEKKFFQTWIDMIFDPIYQNLNYYDQYAIGTIIIHQNSRREKDPVVSYKYIECYPISIQNVDMSYGTENSINEINVNIAFHSWEEKSLDEDWPSNVL